MVMCITGKREYFPKEEKNNILFLVVNQYQIHFSHIAYHR
jgi:hypothetical protein